MRMGRFLALAAALIVLVFQLGCRRTQKAPPTPAAPVPKVEMPPPLKPQAKPLEEPQLPTPPQPTPQKEPQMSPNVITVPPPPPPQPARRTKPTQAAKPKPAEPPPATTPAAPAEETKPVQPAALPEPVLGEVIPGDQARRLEQTLAANLGTAQSVLAQIKGRRLTREQSESANRVRAFIRQSEQARRSDIAVAAELSRRAALLAEDLRKTLE